MTEKIQLDPGRCETLTRITLDKSIMWTMAPGRMMSLKSLDFGGGMTRTAKYFDGDLFLTCNKNKDGNPGYVSVNLSFVKNGQCVTLHNADAFSINDLLVAAGFRGALLHGIDTWLNNLLVTQSTSTH